MTRDKKERNPLTDALGLERSYAAFTKKSRILIIKNATPKKIRDQAKKKGWIFITAADVKSEAPLRSCLVQVEAYLKEENSRKATAEENINDQQYLYKQA